MSKIGKVQRASAFERAAVKEVLKGLWEKAFTDGEMVVNYPETKDGEKKALSLHSALGDYRKTVKKKKAENMQLFLKVEACMLIRSDAFTVKVVKKKSAYSSRSETILELASMLPELGMNETKTGIEDIMKDFKQGVGG